MEPFMTITPLIEGSSNDLEAVARKMGDKLAQSSEKGELQACIYDEEGKTTHYVLKVGNGKSQLQTSKSAKPDFEIVTQKETALQIAKGRLSPLTAFYQGQMRIRGDIELGKRLLARLGSPGGRK
jgi:putative sterol carrier protein